METESLKTETNSIFERFLIVQYGVPSVRIMKILRLRQDPFIYRFAISNHNFFFLSLSTRFTLLFCFNNFRIVIAFPFLFLKKSVTNYFLYFHKRNFHFKDYLKK